MKIYWVLFLFIALASKAQSVKDYESAMKKFQKFYNAGKGDRINMMLRDDTTIMINGRHMWNDIDIKPLIKEYGFLKSFKFLGVDSTDPQNVYVFETKFSKKGTNMTSLTLVGNQLGTFRFITIPDDPKGIKKPAH
jgi:hypothetical protein